jgi:hypothetical protein
LRGLAQEYAPAPKPGRALVGERTSMRLWAWIMRRPWVYAWATHLIRWGQGLLVRGTWIHKIPFYPASRWTENRDFPALAPKPFRDRWKALSKK